MTTAVTSTHLTRSNLWSQQLKDILQDELDAQKWVNWLSEFPDGTTFNIPSVGEATVQTVQEDQNIQYEALDTGNFTFTITEYDGSAHYITRKALQDSFYAQRVLASFVPKERRALMEKLETDILKTPSPDTVNTQGSGGQTVDDTNDINGFKHRYGGGGTGGAVAAADFAYAKLSLKKSNVPLTNLVAIVDPTVAYELETLTNIVNVSNNPQWEGIITTGMTTGMRFIRNIYGFDCYESNYVDTTADSTVVDKSGSSVTLTTSAQNLLFSAAGGDLNPIMGAWRQMPIVDSEFNKDKQREEYVTTARYGLKLYRPENMVCLLTETTL
jgi:hypothetical protein